MAAEDRLRQPTKLPKTFYSLNLLSNTDRDLLFLRTIVLIGRISVLARPSVRPPVITHRLLT